MKFRISDGRSWEIVFSAATGAQFSVEYKKALLRAPTVLSHERVELHFVDVDGEWGGVIHRGLRLADSRALPIYELYAAAVNTAGHVKRLGGAVRFVKTGPRKLRDIMRIV